MSKEERESEIESEKHQDPDQKVTIESFLKPKSRVKRTSTTSVKSGELRTRGETPIDLLELRCLSICLLVRLVRVQEIGDERKDNFFDVISKIIWLSFYRLVNKN